MRAVHHGDVVAAARVLRALPPGRRAAAIVTLLRSAELGDRHRRAHGRAHPVFGTGTLMSAASGLPKLPEPSLDDPDYLDCLHEVIAALIAWRRRAGRENSALPPDNDACHPYFGGQAGDGGPRHGGEEGTAG